MMEEINDVEHWADVAAEELARAFALNGISFTGVSGNEEGNVVVSFPFLADAEAMMTLAIESDNVRGGLYDRSTSNCLTLSFLADHIDDVPDEQLEDVIRNGWQWSVHPVMRVRRMGWHVSCEMPMTDANTVTANLNAIAQGGAL